jgi:hypothetical protein
MHVHDRKSSFSMGEEVRASMLDAAIVLRDLSFLHHRSGGVSLGCRAVMRQHALQWRNQPSRRAEVLDLRRLDLRGDAAKAA